MRYAPTIFFHLIKKMRRIAAALPIMLVVIFATMGFFLSLEIVVRALGVGKTIARGALVNASLFQYAPYVVSSAPKNLVLGRSTHVLESFFRRDPECMHEDVSVRFNNLGFRGPDFNKIERKEVSEIRIIITGGSAAMSWNIAENCTLDSYLGEHLSAQWPAKKITIINLANAAWKSFQELNALMLYAPFLEPDVIITFNGGNDFIHSVYGPIERPYASHQMEQAFAKYKASREGGLRDLAYQFRLREIISSVVFPVRALAFENPHGHHLPLVAETAKFGYVRTRIEELPISMEKAIIRTDFDPYNQSVVNYFVRNQERIASEADRINAIFVATLQPNLFMKWPLHENEIKRLLEDYQPEANFVVQAHMRSAQALERLATSAQHVHFHDFSGIFNGLGSGELIFGDQVHMTKRGYQIIAKSLAEIVVEAIEMNKRQ